MNTKEVAEYLNIHEKQVYALIKAHKIPCTRVTGKWIFPKHLIDEWITANSQEAIKQSDDTVLPVRGSLLAAGSNDPILDILLNDTKQAHPDLYIFTCSTGSTGGLKLLGEQRIDLAWCHLFDPQSGGYNIPYLSEFLEGRKIAVVHLFYRELGFVSSSDLVNNVRSFKDLLNPDIRFINRQKGSGTRVLLDYRLAEAGIEPSGIKGYENEVYTHFEVGLGILSGSANAGIATIAVSKLFGLPFAPIIKESFDMVLPQETFFDKNVQAFMETLKSPSFRQKVKPLGDYDFSESGKIIYATA